MDINDELPVIDFKDPSFILQNLKIDKNYEQAKNYSTATRNNVVEAICYQMCFYVMCTLKSYEDSDLTPMILIYGTGVVGSRIVDALVKYGCAPYLVIFVRDPEAYKKWTAMGLKASTKLTADDRVDIVVMSSNLASFSQICRDIGSNVCPHTAFITSTFGLQRRRIYSILKLSSVFRTYFDISMFADNNPPKRPKAMTAEELAERKFLSLRRSAASLGTRWQGVRNMILILENYYVLSGKPRFLAREIATSLVLGEVDMPASARASASPQVGLTPLEIPPAPLDAIAESPTHCTEIITTRTETARDALDALEKEDVDHDDATLVSALTDIATLETAVEAMASASTRQANIISSIITSTLDDFGYAFQRELSKHIRIVDLPPLLQSAYASPVKPATPMSRARQLRLLQNPEPPKPKNIDPSYLMKEHEIINIFKSDMRYSEGTELDISLLKEMDAASTDFEDNGADYEIVYDENIMEASTADFGVIHDEL